MTKRRSETGFTLLEFIVVVTMIGVLAASSLSYYADIVRDTRISGVQFLSSRFAAAVAGVHVKWIVDGQPKSVELDGFQLQLNDSGWPIAETSRRAGGKNVCRQLWDSLLQNPSQLPDVIPADSKGVQYWAPKPSNDICRYNLITRDSREFYFEYFMRNGQVRSVTDYLE
ncbi:MAG: hypothetical protein CL693_16580 [Cellvibrionaceae bacterium]|nr:hypothetical protein [Cellvibrionaceae bacterium]